MIRPLCAVLILTVAASGCSRLNPGTWLNAGAQSPTPQGMVTAAPKVEDARPLVAQVTALNVDRTPDGAIVRATGLPPTQGWYNAGLVARPVNNGTLTLEFRAAAPTGDQPVGTTATREVIAATAINNETLQGATQIVVRGATNALSSR